MWHTIYLWCLAIIYIGTWFAYILPLPEGNAGWPNPKKWHYNNATGEFYKITGMAGDVVQFLTDNYARRVGTYINVKKEMRDCIFSQLLSIVLWVFSNQNKDNNWHLVIILAYILFFTNTIYTPMVLYDYVVARVGIGPKNREITLDNHGPAIAETPPDNPAQDGLDYKPRT